MIEGILLVRVGACGSEQCQVWIMFGATFRALRALACPFSSKYDDSLGPFRQNRQIMGDVRAPPSKYTALSNARQNRGPFRAPTIPPWLAICTAVIWAVTLGADVVAPV